MDAERIYVDHGLTGTHRDRPGLRQALTACRADDALVVTKLDRGQQPGAAGQAQHAFPDAWIPLSASRRGSCGDPRDSAISWRIAASSSRSGSAPTGPGRRRTIRAAGSEVLCRPRGPDRVYELGKDFRNEGLAPKHLPEFTMLEFYEACADYADVAARFERLIHAAAQAIGCAGEIDFTPPWTRKPFGAAIQQATGTPTPTARSAACRPPFASGA